MAHHGKRVLKAREGVERTKLYKLEEAVKLVKTNASAKFDETVELAINLGVDPKHADQMVRGTVVLPHGLGKSKKVLAIAGADKQKEAQAAGADHVGGEEMVDKIQGGFMDFDDGVEADRTALLPRGDVDLGGRDHVDVVFDHRLGVIDR